MITREESEAMNIAPRGRIKIVAKKVWIKGEPMYEIMHVEAAKLNELPETYLRTAPYCYLRSDGNGLHLYGNLYLGDEPTHRELEVGRVYTIKDYTEFVEIAKKAGEHLTALMEMYQGVLYKGWSGDQVDII
jgi:hypothetical protein